MSDVTLYTDEGAESTQALELLKAHKIPFNEIRKGRDAEFDYDWYFPTISAPGTQIFHHSGLFWIKQAIFQLTSCPILYIDALEDNQDLLDKFDDPEDPIVVFTTRELARADPMGYWTETYEFPALILYAMEGDPKIITGLEDIESWLNS
ncbi:hypothetical protein A2962_04130 [Candidatus Woesebacteria bacterium RIFCSPLOWO2_01_FULL_39_61]|uniref:Uncharacterized protein n=1 Tax=Candidatus Woesebacteria bacterium RIFCSPHIGHO2_02_FULL_39_13 TaxID=1802505 RepID=A0A1F7YY64_9BACT|nr:MAG: hypothetical protein A2692_00485 [Candidatus Woesebacteria bacterium RIFCSPHIGHO2_01_FULL_39_95]OGM32150.1 MAG: hypothetical protein A3D01_02065 [Candidatus Woesebacteria bacterium RIFCSPHIGHO2_02_FULL_39_13]OGM36600.1 MAG: hypothetical protein A3E13_02905 [Candidatus Woesebacteria bacterium RIFCSPHIGHO2_12_FULL_40_20]OGM65941.1 MAG: hypothetical protein A2962_04130 [Candidatus Woesebacteria bacterium RIFCSPLOWO2_01_FULL_39_61]OGM71418.1 MAG: hypothetical protein A3H19_04605 [Candidatus